MTSPWFPPQPDGSPALRLLCVPFAGGGAGIYRTWQRAMPEGVHVVPVQLPGRERRLREKAHTAMAPLLSHLVPAVLGLVDGPWALFGHSMGAAVAYELARATTAAGKAPQHLFLSARRGPGEPPTHPPLFAMSEGQLIAETERLYGPLPAVLRDNPGLLRTFLPTMRADFQLLDTWTAPTDRVLSCPITVYGGARDHAIPTTALDAWSTVTDGPFRKVILDGDHFSYVRDTHEARDDVAAVLAG